MRITLAERFMKAVSYCLSRGPHAHSWELISNHDRLGIYLGVLVLPSSFFRVAYYVHSSRIDIPMNTSLREGQVSTYTPHIKN